MIEKKEKKNVDNSAEKIKNRRKDGRAKSAHTSE